MRRCRIAVVILVACAAVVLSASSARATLSLTVPASKNLGTVAVGASSISAQLGAVTASNTGLLVPSLSAQVSCTAFKTGGGTTNETIPCTSVSYWSGPATVATNLTSNTPGQIDAAHAVALGSTRTAFSATATLINITLAWNPTVIVTLPTNAVAGGYTGTITHSVA